MKIFDLKQKAMKIKTNGFSFYDPVPWTDEDASAVLDLYNKYMKLLEEKILASIIYCSSCGRSRVKKQGEHCPRCLGFGINNI